MSIRTHRLKNSLIFVHYTKFSIIQPLNLFGYNLQIRILLIQINPFLFTVYQSFTTQLIIIIFAYILIIYFDI